ncbi:hypothetical protein Goshw_009477 [Gossypium schwendimanii]|uniref:Uncharacterized protein n=1 Tax=Gossypium schwendimanii TaxID=34291 RepID=A0A7J9L8W6_GOSSC|nr:hypothetical protein [Gossypium schwendimanii]
MGNIETVLSISIVFVFFLQLLLLPKLCGMVQQLPPSNYLVLLVINGIKDTSSKKYIEGKRRIIQNGFNGQRGWNSCWVVRAPNL